MSLAERPVRRHIARITASTDNVAYVQTLLESEDRDFVVQFLATHSPHWQREGVSLDEMLQLEVRRRYMNGQWIKSMAFAHPGALAAEQLRLTALQNVLLLQIIEELRESGVARAAVDMAGIRSEMAAQLLAAHRAAAR
jgi:cobalamin biosynthesis Mg chelatase CobN